MKPEREKIIRILTYFYLIPFGLMVCFNTGNSLLRTTFLFATFIYGDMIGWCLGICAIYFVIRYLKSDSIRYATDGGFHCAFTGFGFSERQFCCERNL